MHAMTSLAFAAHRLRFFVLHLRVTETQGSQASLWQRHNSTRPTPDIYSHTVGPNQLAAQASASDELKCHGAVQ